MTADLEAFEAQLLAEQPDLEARAEALFAAGRADSARALLTRYTGRRLLDALALGEALVERVEGETRARFGIRPPAVDLPEGASWRPASEPMTMREGRTYHRCWVPGTAGYPRRHGGHASLASPELARSVYGGGGGGGSSTGRWAAFVLVGVVAATLGMGAGWMLRRPQKGPER